MLAAMGLISSCDSIPGSKLENALNPNEIVSQPQTAQAKIGAREHPGIVSANGGAYKNARLEKMLAGITGTLIAHSSSPNTRYTITVLNSPNINAFALPGGYLYITRGLLALANNSAEVAAVLAHELAHISANHGIERSKKLDSAKLADRVVMDVLTNDRAGKIALAADKINFAKFSRNQELQADALGIKMIGNAGYDAFAAAQFLTSMDKYAHFQSALSAADADEDFLASHPSTPMRIELAKRHARFFGAPGSGIRNRDAFLSSIDGMLFGNSAKEGFVRGNRFSHLGLGITFRVPTGFQIANKADAVLISGPNEVAVRFDGVSQPRTVSLSQYLTSGWVNGLDGDSLVTMKINGLNAIRGTAAADDWLFDITLIRLGTQIYRFILAAPKSATNALSVARQISGTFRKLTRQEKKQLRPLKLKIVQTAPSDTIASLASRMEGVPRKLELFRLLNALGQGDRLKPGQKVKLVVNGR